ncbi:MAG: Dihydrofolate reductase [Candidatus Dichloromethanomonas elyunquensis]|nr:MAG: Dihydrofolate reductase [Candidatus Dichloromethanomonas elyunquensis]
MKIIVAVDQNWGIGYKGNLLQRIPEDMKFFKQMTMNKVVIMGRGTYDSLPGKEPLKDRINIVLSKSLWDNRVVVCRSLDEIFLEIAKYDTDDLCVIGGESVFRLLLPYCAEAYVTKIDKVYPADTYFEDIDKNKHWKLYSEGELKTYRELSFKFTKYIKV